MIRLWLLLALLLPLPALAKAPDAVPAALAGSYNDQNPFARIIRGELPAAKVYEDSDVLAFMDNSPVAPGHVLVISKTSKARNLLEIDPADLDKVMRVAQRIMRAQLVALGCDGVTVTQNNGAGQTVFHLHVHLIPRSKGVPMLPPAARGVDVATLETVAARIRAAL
jgi:histidine triad (HIT) family protein